MYKKNKNIKKAIFLCNFLKLNISGVHTHITYNQA